MPFTGSTHSLPVGSLTSDGSLSNAATQHNAPLNDISDCLTTVKTLADALNGGSVRYDIAQTLSDVEKLRARGNIGLTDEVVADLSTVLLSGSAVVATAVDTGTGELTVPINHDLATATPVYVAVTSGSATADSIYWIYRDPNVHDKVKLCNSYDDAHTGTALTLASGTTPSMKVHRDPTLSIINTTGKKKDGSEGGILVAPYWGAVTPRTFGADATASDNSLALQMTIHWVATAYRAASGGFAVSGDGENVSYRHTRPLNGGQIRSPQFVFRNLSLNSACAGKVALDTSGCSSCTWDGLTINGEEANAPLCGRLISRVHEITGLGPTTYRAPVPAASDNDFKDERIYGYYTGFAVVEVNSDLAHHRGSKYANKHPSKNAGVGIVCASQAAIVRQHGVAITSSFWPIPDGTYSSTLIGSITESEWDDCNFRRTFDYSLTPTAINATATPIILTFTGTQLADNGIVTGTVIYVTVNQGFDLPRNRYMLKNVTATTAELWNEDGLAQVSHLTGGVDGGAVTGVYSSGRVTNSTISPFIVAGPVDRVTCNGYMLSYDRSSVELDLTDGNIGGSRMSIHCESGGARSFDVIPHASTARVLENAQLHVSGDLIGDTHFYKRPGGAVSFDGSLKVDGPQSGTPSIVLNSNMRLIKGDLTNLTVNANLRTTLEDMMSNLADFTIPITGTWFDSETNAFHVLPSGEYTPTFTGVTNITSVTLLSSQLWHYSTNGRYVTCWGRLTITPSAVGSCTFRISLPPGLGANLTANSLVGGGSRQGTSDNQLSISADATNEEASVIFTSTATAAFNATVTFDYAL